MTVIHKVRLLQVVKGSNMLRHEIIGRENRSTYLSGNKKHMRVKSYQFIKLAATFFCLVSHFLCGRICVFHTSKELRPNHYNEKFSTTNGYVIPAVW